MLASADLNRTQTGSIHGPSKPAARHKGLNANAEVPVPKDIFPPRPGKPDYLNQTLAWAKGPDGTPIAASDWCMASKCGSVAASRATCSVPARS